MKLLKSKKGDTTELQYSPLFTIIFAALVILLLFGYAKSWDNSTFLKRNFLAKDVSLIIETMHLASSGMEITYPDELEDVQILFDNKNVGVKNLYDDGTTSLANYPYIGIKEFKVPNIKIPDLVLDPSKKTKPFNLYFNLNNKYFTIQTSKIIQTTNPITYQVSSILTKDDDWENKELLVTFFEANKINNPNFQLYEDNEDTYLETPCQALTSNPYFITTRDECNKDKVRTDLSNIILKIIFAIETDNTKTNALTIYYFDTTKSKKLAEIIRNKVKLSIDTLDLVHKNIEIKNSNDYSLIDKLPNNIKDDKPGVIIVFGRQNNKKSFNKIINKMNSIIQTSLMEYYK